MASENQQILIVDDEPESRALVESHLQNAGYAIATATHGVEAIRKAQGHPPALVILELLLPGMDGLEVCKTLRRDERTSAIPIVILTAKAGEIDRILALELGADDYLTKPFSPRELVLRVRRLLRTGEQIQENIQRIAVRDICLNLPAHQVTLKGKPLELTATEFKLLTVLAQRRGRVQSREQLLRDVWEYETNVDTRTVDTHVRRLRSKLKGASKYVRTVRGIGYRLIEE